MGLVALGAVPDLPITRVIAPPLAAFAAVVLVAANVRPDGSSARLLNWGPLTHLGRRSYGLYLWHFPILFGWWATGSPLWALVPCLALAWCLTLLSWRYVESPWLGSSKRTTTLQPAPTSV